LVQITITLYCSLYCESGGGASPLLPARNVTSSFSATPIVLMSNSAACRARSSAFSSSSSQPAFSASLLSAST
jgi:hypothetical protein